MNSAEIADLQAMAEEHCARDKLLNPLEWRDPERIGDALLPVQEFAAGLLPDDLKDWAVDTAERLDKMPLDYPAIAIVVALGGMVGRRVVVQPKKNDPWVVAPNLWGAAVGSPSTKKSPSLKSAIKFPRGLEIEEAAIHEAAMVDFNAQVEASKLHKKAMEPELKKTAKKDKHRAVKMLKEMASDETKAPTAVRYLVNDTTIEKLGELFRENPSGLLLFRDELTGWLSSLDREGREQDRAFFLESWDGTGSFTWDRIGRGTIDVPSLCLGVLGGIQPAKIAPYLRSMTSGSGDDGLLQRFQLLVWPDARKPERVDRKANLDASDKVTALFRRISEITDYSEDQDAYKFDADAQDVFDNWYDGMLSREHDEPNSYIESHLTKYHSLMPSLALIFHLVEGDGSKVIGDIAATRAVAWCNYLETHARRVYALATDPYYGARQLHDKLLRLPTPFERKDFNNKGWSGLTNKVEIDAAIDTLIERNCIRKLIVVTGTKPKTLYFTNPHMKNENF